jgi:very-short-patch-repair endonuclease
MCSGYSLAAYKMRHPDATYVSNFCSRRIAKTQDQKEHQSEVLRARFQTEAGQKTKKQISEASKRMQAGEYGRRAAAHLRSLNQDPEFKKAASMRSRRMWEDPAFRKKQRQWVENNRKHVLDSAAHARRHHSKTSKLHLEFKSALDLAGVRDFLTEHRVGYYEIDEANPELRVAVEVDGCYWHGCTECGYAPQPKMASLDIRKQTYLEKRGWKVVRLKECSIRGDLEGCISQVQEACHGSRD